MLKLVMVEELESSAAVPERTDPRVRRTRQMLFSSLEELLRTSSIEEIAVADIANHAGLNRGTFYDHYPDKFALLEGLVECNFQKLLRQRDIRFDGTCVYAAMGITLAACDYLASVPRVGCPDHRRVTEKHLEAAISSVVRGMMLEGLKRHPGGMALKPELLAASVAGAIFGAAREWVGNPERGAAEEVGEAILTVFRPVLNLGGGSPGDTA